jgi:NADP-reducing hydrogenase subunit HndD
MAMIVNGKEVLFSPGETVLQAAGRAGIHIPHLCAWEWSPSPSASCRLCLVEVEGSPRLETSCTLPAADGLVVRTHSARVQKARRSIVELMVANHPQDCLACSRSGSCELAELAREVGVRPNQYVGMKKDHHLDISSPAIWRDPNKCILCGRCVTMCQQIQGVGAIDYIGRGFKTQVGPAFFAGINVSTCTFCGQCVRVCPTGALAERSAVDEVATLLGDPDNLVVAQVAPAVPATLDARRGRGQGIAATLEQLAAALKRMGFAAVFDTAFAADLCVMEEAAELVRRLQGEGPLPMFTSCSPAWIQYVEVHRPDLLPHLSTCKSPQQMAGALIKEIYPRYLELAQEPRKAAGERPQLAGRRLVVVSFMPCTAKKYEAQELGDVDYVLTTRELEVLAARFGLDLEDFSERTPLDPPFVEATGAARLFPGTGGVMEAAVRTTAALLAGETELSVPGAPALRAGTPVAPLVEARGLDGVKYFRLEVADRCLRLGVINGLGRLKPALDEALRECDFVEVMSCPGGCVGGGGQPYAVARKTGKSDGELRRRLDRLYQADETAPLPASHQNSAVAALYQECLGHPLSEVSHRLLHRTYLDRSRLLMAEMGSGSACALGGQKA